MKTIPSNDLTPAKSDEWLSYDDFAAGIDTYRAASSSLSGVHLDVSYAEGAELSLAFASDHVRWKATGPLATEAELTDPYDAVRVRDDVVFVHLPLESSSHMVITVVYSETTHRALVVRSRIADAPTEGVPQVGQEFWAGVTGGGRPSGEVPAPSRDLIGKRNLYRYSPHHLYEHIYISSERYAWQCVQGVQRGHGDTEMTTTWKFADGLYLFCFREFRIPVASVWLHDLSYALRTTGVFLGLAEDGNAKHSRAGGHVYPLGAVSYPDVEPI